MGVNNNFLELIREEQILNIMKLCIIHSHTKKFGFVYETPTQHLFGCECMLCIIMFLI